MSKVEKQVTNIYREFENATAFKNQINLTKDIQRSVMFENGRQWRMDDSLKEYPKITLNIIKQIGKTRKSNILQNEYGYHVNSNNFRSVRKIQDFLRHLSQTINIRMKDLKALHDDFTKGTAIGYFYWDADKRGFLSKSGGQMRYEMIDIRNFVVADPYTQTIQDQEWVSFVTRQKIIALHKKYGVDKEKLIADGNLYTSDTEPEVATDEHDDELVNVYTKFYRNHEGQVFFEIATQNVVLKEATPLNPFYEDPEEKKEAQRSDQLMDDKEPKDKRVNRIWAMYPFCRLSLNERDNMFYGYPITLEYLESQKSINNHFSIYDKALQDNVLGGFMFKRGVLGDNELTTENGQMLELDIGPGEQINGVLSRIPVANVPTDSHRYSESLIGVTRQVAGAMNVQLGLSDFSGQSGKQTEMLLQRARENASDTSMMFNEFKREQAEIMFLFAKFFYDNESFVVIDHGIHKDNAREYLGKEAFHGTDYLDDDVYIDIRVGVAPSFSEYSNIEMLGLMVQSGQAPFEAYINMLPDGYISNRQELLEMAQDNSNKKIQELQQVIEQQKEIMEQMVGAYKETQKDRKNIDVVINENERLKSMLAEISANAIKQVSNATAENQEMVREMQKILEVVNKQN